MLAEVAAVGAVPFVVLLDQDVPGQAEERGRVGEGAHDVHATLTVGNVIITERPAAEVVRLHSYEELLHHEMGHRDQWAAGGVIWFAAWAHGGGPTCTDPQEFAVGLTAAYRAECAHVGSW